MRGVRRDGVGSSRMAEVVPGNGPRDGITYLVMQTTGRLVIFQPVNIVKWDGGRRVKRE